jgi:hypothetical protein
MDKLKTRNEYVGCNGKCRFYADTNTATSYNWWHFVAEINGKIIFNDYNYSHTTRRHQDAVRSLLRSLKIKVDAYVDFSDSLNEYNFKTYALRKPYGRAISMIVQNHTPRVRTKTKEDQCEK